jgi:predicted phosphodiesterase
MLIGVMSDSHDNLPLIEKAVALLNQQRWVGAMQVNSLRFCGSETQEAQLRIDWRVR